MVLFCFLENKLFCVLFGLYTEDIFSYLPWILIGKLVQTLTPTTITWVKNSKVARPLRSLNNQLNTQYLCHWGCVWASLKVVNVQVPCRTSLGALLVSVCSEAQLKWHTNSGLQGEFCIDYVDYTQMFHHFWVLLERIIKGLPKQLNWWCRFNLMLWKKPASWDTLASRSRPQKEILSYFTMPSTFNQFCPEASSSERLNPNLYCDGKAVWWRGSQRVNECSGAGCFETWMENPNRSD